VRQTGVRGVPLHSQYDSLRSEGNPQESPFEGAGQVASGEPHDERTAVGTEGGRCDFAELIQQRLALVWAERLTTPDGGAAGEGNTEIIQPVGAIYGGVFGEGAGECGGGCNRQRFQALCCSGDVGHGAHEEDTATEGLAVKSQGRKLMQARLQLLGLPGC